MSVAGTYKFASQDKFDDYLKATGMYRQRVNETSHNSTAFLKPHKRRYEVQNTF